jgi:HlyD family secretion protein
MLRLLGALVLILAAAAGAAAWLGYFHAPKVPEVRQLTATRGDILQTVSATGTLQATRTVDVGSQVSGIVKKLYVDYNSIVAKGQLIAEMDPSTIEVQVESAQASLDRATIDLDGLQSTLRVDEANRDREEQLFAHHLATEQDREQGELQVKEDEALIKQDASAVSVARDNLKQAQVNLSYCTIRSPVDGVVVTRNADEGQTVAASVSVPSLFIIATDVRTLDLLALVDESDIGKLHPDQDVIFTVSAYPNRQFHGVLDHVRLNSVSSNNVISYQAVSTVANPELRLMPSMTASVKVQIAQADDVVRVPNVALRFKPTAEMFKAFGQPVPAEGAAAPAAGAAPAPSAPARATTAPTPGPTGAAGTMIDRRFKSLPRQSSTGQVWVFEDHRLRSEPLQLGITDGTWTELVGGSLRAGDQLVTSVSVPAQKR